MLWLVRMCLRYQRNRIRFTGGHDPVVEVEPAEVSSTVVRISWRDVRRVRPWGRYRKPDARRASGPVYIDKDVLHNVLPRHMAKVPATLCTCDPVIRARHYTYVGSTLIEPRNLTGPKAPPSLGYLLVGSPGKLFSPVTREMNQFET
jgi:hypothetical protein